MVDRLLKQLAGLFEVRDPHTRLDRTAALVLALVLIVGAFVRFWDLGAVGLHGDEKTMALPMLHLVQHGTPMLPSGMFYPRAVAQLYLMAASVLAFGQSEWAMRVPSALCGVLLIGLAWTAGRRFLEPAWNLAFTAAVAFLPDFIEDAQTARMYVFLVTSVAAFMTLVFTWERTNRSGYLIAAVAVMLVGLQFHTLAIFSAFLVFMPGLLRGDSRRFWTGAVAFVVIVAGFYVIDTLIARAYWQDVAADTGPNGNGPRAALIPHIELIWLAAAALPAVIFAWFVARWRTGAAVAGRDGANRDGLGRNDAGLGAAHLVAGAVPMRAIAAAALAAGLVAALSLHYHLAALLIIAGFVVARREGKLFAPKVALFLGVAIALMAAQAVYLHTQAAGSARQIVGLMLGWPSVWPFLAIAETSPFAAALAAAGVACGVWQLAHRQRVPDFLLLIVLGVWVPLLMIGFMRWDIPPRYAEAQTLPLLMGAFAVAQWAAQRLITAQAPGAVSAQGSAARAGAVGAAGAQAHAGAASAAGMRAGMAHAGAAGAQGSVAGAQGSFPTPVSAQAGVVSARLGTLVAALACVLVVNPARVAGAVASGYANHPDHKGAAEFVESLHPGPRDIIVAEDVLQQTYYLGHVDYWLVNKQVGAVYMHKVNGQWLDFYTNTPLIGTGEELKQLLQRPGRGAVYVIGSGEDQEDGRKLMRSFGIADALRGPQFKVVFRGRDRVTEVWKADAPRDVSLSAGRG